VEAQVATEDHHPVTLGADDLPREAEVVGLPQRHVDKGLGRVQPTEKTVDDVAEADHPRPHLVNRSVWPSSSAHSCFIARLVVYPNHTNASL